MPKRFSPNYDTYSQWLKDHPKQTSYVRRIIRLRGQYPNASLSQLRGHAGKGQRDLSKLKPLSFSKRSYTTFSQEQSQKRSKALSVLSEMRQNRESLARASRNHDISPETVKRYTGAFEKRGNRWIAKSTDRLSRGMAIVENGRLSYVEVKSSKDATKISQYFHALDEYRKTGKRDVLDKFKGRYVTDDKGQRHYFDIDDPKQILREIDSISVPEGFSIYRIR